MDPILAALPPSLLKLVEGSLSNDEVSSDEEMLEYFISNGLTEAQARQAIVHRRFGQVSPGEVEIHRAT